MKKVTKKTEEKVEQQTTPVKEPTVDKTVEAGSTATKKNTNSTNKKKAKSTTKTNTTTQIKSRSIAISLLALVAVLAIGIAVYDFWLLRMQASVNTQVNNNQSGFERRIVQLEQALRNTKDQLSTEIRARENLQSQQEAVNNAVQGISEKLGRSTVAWRMAEVEYLLTVANHRLTLAQDRQTAIAVFATADSRLKAIADPSLLKVRKIIASELAALRGVPNVDIPGLAVQLSSMVEDVEQLPLIDKKRLEVAAEKPQSKTALEWQEIPAAVWNDVKSLVRVRRQQQPTEPLLPPDQAWFLYQNLQLKLEQARLAVLQKNTELLTQSLAEVSRWLTSYFDTESAAVMNMQATLKKLREIELRSTIPDVSGSLRELRAVMNIRATTNDSSASQPASSKVATQ